MRATVQEWLHVHSMKFWQGGFDVLSRSWMNWRSCKEKKPEKHKGVMRITDGAHYAFLIKFVLLGRHRELCSQVYLNYICDVQEVSMTDLRWPKPVSLATILVRIRHVSLT